MLRHVFFILVITLSLSLQAQSFTWTRTTAPTTQNLWGICYEGKQFVAVGEGGTILTSIDGATWTLQKSGTSAWLTAVCYANGLYVVVGDNGTILTSTDGISWTSRSATGLRLNGIAYGNGRFVAVGESGIVRSSTDAVQWTTQKLPIDTWLRGIAYGPDSFLIGGADGMLCSTEDGVTFRFAGELYHSIEAITFANGTAMAVGNNYSVSASGDRLGWNRKTPAYNPGNFRGVARIGQSVIAVGEAGSVFFDLFTPNSVSQPVSYALDAPNLNAVASGPTNSVIVGNGGAIFISSQGPLEPPTISGQSISPGTPFIGGSISFSAGVSGSPPLVFKWTHSDAAIPGGSTNRLVLKSLTAADAGNYTLAVTNSAGSATTTFTLPPPVSPPSSIAESSFIAGNMGSIADITGLPGGQLLGRRFNHDQLLRFNADGSWDLSFRPPPSWGSPFLALDGKVFVHAVDAHLTKLLPNGAIDSRFTSNIDYGTPIPLADGKILCISVDQNNRALLTRLNEDGARDDSYSQSAIELEQPGGSGGMRPNFEQFLSTRDDDGGIFIAAVSHQSVGTGAFGVNESRLFRLRTDGTVDASFAPVTLNEAFEQLIWANGQIYYHSSWREGDLGSTYYDKFARLDVQGKVDPHYGPIVSSYGYSSQASPVLLNDGSVLRVNGSEFLRHSSEGSIDKTFRGQFSLDAGSAIANIARLLPLSNGQIVVQGGFSSVNGIPSGGLARLSIPTRDPATHLVNLSIRTLAGSGDQTLIAGFVVSGKTSSRSVLVRGVGPGLVPLGVNARDVVADPELKLFKGSSAFATNDNWDPALAGTAAALGAYPLARDSKDAAILATLTPGPYTVHVTNATNAAGIALIELYDADGAPNSAADARLVNLSGRARVGTGDNVLIAGFVLAGKGTKRLLVRAVGPGLQKQGVTDFLPNPILSIYHGSDVIATNDNWTATDSTLEATFTAVGAFALDAGSEDSALVLDAAPGVYTAIVRGVGNTTGSALVEVYEVP